MILLFQTIRKYELLLLGSLVTLATGSLSIFAVLAAPFNTAVLMRHGIVFFSNRGWLALLLLIVLAAYTIFVIRAKKIITTRAHFITVLLFVGAISVILLFAPPFFSSDVYGYIVRSGAAQVHDVSIYGPTPSAIGYGEVVAWPDGGWVYGPLATIITQGITYIGGTDVLTNLLLFRIVSIIGLGVCGWLMYRILKIIRPSFAWAGTAIFLLNPFVLYEAVQSAHNDIWMMICVLGFVFMMIRRWYVGAVLFVVASFLIKFGTLILLPIPFWCMLRQLPWRRALPKVVFAIVVSAALVFVAYAPFGNIHDNLGNLGRAFIKDNNLTFLQGIIIWGEEIAASLIPSFTVNLASVRSGYLLAFALAYTALFFYPRLCKKNAYTERAFWMLLIFLFLLGGKFNIWYVLWALPLLVIIPRKGYRALLVIMTGYAFLYYILLSVFIPNVLFCIAVVIWAAIMFIDGSSLFSPKIKPHPPMSLNNNS